MVDKQTDVLAQSEIEIVRSEQRPLSSGLNLQSLTFALEGNEQFESSVLRLANKALLEQGAEPQQLCRSTPTLISITSTAERASKHLRNESGGLSLNGLPSIQRITHADVFL